MDAGTGIITTIAGTGTAGFAGDGGPAISAVLNRPTSVVLDAVGSLYFSDGLNNRVRKIAVGTGIVTTVAGDGTSGSNGGPNGDGGLAVSAQIFRPSGMAFDAAGNLYVAEAGHGRIRRVSAATAIISTVAGTIANFGGDGGPATNARLASPTAVEFDMSGNLYIADTGNKRIRRVAASTGIITTVAGTGVAGAAGDNGPATAAQFIDPLSLAVDSAGDIYVADDGAGKVREILAPSGRIQRIAGGGSAGDGGLAVKAQLYYPSNLSLNQAGNLYISDFTTIQRVDASGVISSVVGTANPGFSGDKGPATAAQIGLWPGGSAVDTAGNLFFADAVNSVVRRVDAATHVITTVAGTGTFTFSGDGGLATAASLFLPEGVALDRSGNLYIADLGNHRIRRVAAASGIITTVAGVGSPGFSGDGSLATGAQLHSPSDVGVDAKGNIFVADALNDRIRRIDAGTGIINTVAGGGSAAGSNGVPAIQAQLQTPEAIALDSTGNLYIADSGHHWIRKVDSSGVIATIAGDGIAVFGGDGGLASAAHLNSPQGLAVDPSGIVYVADAYNNRIRMLTPNVAARLTIDAGNGQSGAPGDVLRIGVLVIGSAGLPVGGVVVNFQVTSGIATVTTDKVTTDSAGKAVAAIKLGDTAGPVIVTATAAGLPSLQFQLTVKPAAFVPTISAGGVAGAGGSVPAVTQISPGALATIYGSNFAPQGTARQLQAGDLVGGNLPTSLASVCVQVGNTLGFPIYVSPGLINFQVPDVPVNSSVSVQVVTNCGAANEIRSAP